MCGQGKQVLKEEKKMQKWLIANLIFLIITVFSVGAWVRGIEKDLVHLSEQMELRTDDRFYRQDGLILEGRIAALENNYQRIEDALLRLDNKLEANH